jgi:anti-sigma factor RsiW
MCPDRELLSAYVDGEVPSPWRERIAEHLASCPSCASAYEGYAALGRAIRADVPAGEAQALSRVRDRLEASLAAMDDPSPGRVVPFRPALWRRSVRLPLPVAAAAALVALAAGGAATALAFGQRAQGAAFVASSQQAVATPAIASPNSQPSSMDELLRYLDAHDAQVTITMNLPTGTRFDDSGEPVIIRASQESPGTPVQLSPDSGGGSR